MISSAMDFPILIIGSGPSEATTALHLARHGIKALVMSRHRGPANTPFAHIFNQRAMEVLHDTGLDTRLATVASSACDMQHTSWVHPLAGDEYGRLCAWGNKPARKGDCEMASPCVMSDLPRLSLSQFWRKKLLSSGSNVGASAQRFENSRPQEGSVELEVSAAEGPNDKRRVWDRVCDKARVPKT